MGCRANGLACSDPGARIPIGTSGNCSTPTHKALNLPHSRRFLTYFNLSFKATQTFKINMQPKYTKFNCIIYFNRKIYNRINDNIASLLCNTISYMLYNWPQKLYDFFLCIHLLCKIHRPHIIIVFMVTPSITIQYSFEKTNIYIALCSQYC